MGFVGLDLWMLLFVKGSIFFQLIFRYLFQFILTAAERFFLGNFIGLFAIKTFQNIEFDFA